ncbi:uncharacterized protein STEHIDRAFT_164715 [Stereum hirsutum FP-91666 SS1]|uniref:uncharacterized protein n=1 Tax=Stereum hirsutum (strain FP-91666) TaxID=721885 RepID=UPI000440F71F|nr:uncharacterized protein STEHIDRAFT_164715 [Stereum hirsutum FP-91666 SS1]EIM92433.1 hypothetical protein STEHIDRAFT_164715 [Stereum hirsutum FP-91666 SS1]
MSVATKNPFALLDEESSSPSATPAPSKATPAAETTTPAANNRGGSKPRGGPASRGGGYYRRGGKPREGGDAPPAGDDAPATEGRRFDGEGRGRGRGRGRGGDRGDRGRGGRGGGRQDRHSASGKVDTEKRVNQGWGAEEGKAELNAETAGATDAVAEEKDASNEWGVTATDATAAADDPWATTTTPADGAAAVAPAEGEKPAEEGRKPREREVEEEDNTLTYEQYLAQQKEKAEAEEKLQLREANEGDDSWKDTLAVQKKNEEEDAYFVGKSKSAPKPRAKKEEKVFIEIDARFERPSRGGRGRGGDRGGGRGGERGARGRGGPRGGGRGARQNGAPAAAAVNVDDETAFPSLS